MKFSVIIPTCHRNDDLARCLERLAPGAQTLAASDYEVIVSDDGRASTAETMVQEQFPWARWFAGPRRGPATNRNAGAKRAAADWLVFVDDDCLPAQELLAGYLTAIEKYPDQTVLEGRTSAWGERTRVDEEAPVNECGGYLWSCNFAIKGSRFAELGEFDENFTTAFLEDVELYTRIKKRGLKAVFVPEARVFHPWRRQPGRQVKIAHEKSLKYYLSKHPELANHHVPGVLIKNLIRFIVKLALNDCRRYRGRGFVRACWLKIYVTYLVIKNRNDDQPEARASII